MPAVSRDGVAVQSSGEDLDVAFVAEVVEQDETAATDSRVGVDERRSAEKIQRDSSAVTKLREAPARSRDVCPDEFFDSLSVGLGQHDRNLRAGWSRLVLLFFVMSISRLTRCVVQALVANVDC